MMDRLPFIAVPAAIAGAAVAIVGLVSDVTTTGLVAGSIIGALLAGALSLATSGDEAATLNIGAAASPASLAAAAHQPTANVHAQHSDGQLGGAPDDASGRAREFSTDAPTASATGHDAEPQPQVPPGAVRVEIAKQGNSADECEDASIVAPNGRVAAVADGASSSFDSRTWARILVEAFVEQPPPPLAPESATEWLDRSRAAFASRQQNGDSWWGAAGSETGAFAAFAGVTVTDAGHGTIADFMFVGDCASFVLQPDGAVRSALPFEDADQLGSHPALISSKAGSVVPMWARVQLQPGERIVLATDAVAEWLLGDRTRIGTLLAQTPEAIATVLTGHRRSGAIVNDDLTLLAMATT